MRPMSVFFSYQLIKTGSKPWPFPFIEEIEELAKFTALCSI